MSGWTPTHKLILAVALITAMAIQPVIGVFLLIPLTIYVIGRYL